MDKRLHRIQTFCICKIQLSICRISLALMGFVFDDQSNSVICQTCLFSRNASELTQPTNRETLSRMHREASPLCPHACQEGPDEGPSTTVLGINSEFPGINKSKPDTGVASQGQGQDVVQRSHDNESSTSDNESSTSSSRPTHFLNTNNGTSAVTGAEGGISSASINNDNVCSGEASRRNPSPAALATLPLPRSISPGNSQVSSSSDSSLKNDDSAATFELRSAKSSTPSVRGPGKLATQLKKPLSPPRPPRLPTPAPQASSGPDNTAILGTSTVRESSSESARGNTTSRQEVISEAESIQVAQLQLLSNIRERQHTSRALLNQHLLTRTVHYRGTLYRDAGSTENSSVVRIRSSLYVTVITQPALINLVIEDRPNVRPVPVPASPSAGSDQRQSRPWYYSDSEIDLGQPPTG